MLPETRIVTRHRATRPVLITFHERQILPPPPPPSSLRDVFFLPFFFITPRKSIPRRKQLLFLAEETRRKSIRVPGNHTPPLLSAPLLLPHEAIIRRIDRCRGSRRGIRNRRIGGIDRNVDRVEANNGTRAINGGTLDARSERTVAGHGLLLIDFTGSATRRVITSESCASPGQSFHLSRINYDRSGIIRRLIRIRGGGEGEDG